MSRKQSPRPPRTVRLVRQVILMPRWGVKNVIVREKPVSLPFVRFIDGLIAAELDSLIDRDAWAEAEASEEQSKTVLQSVLDRWDDVVNFLGE